MAFRIKEMIDTNILVRLATKDNVEQCLKIQDLFMRHEIEYDVVDLAITEAVYVLTSCYGWTRQQIIEVIQTILKVFPLQYNVVLFEQVFPMYLRHPGLSFNDCCLAAYAKTDDAKPLWTFDRALAQKCEDTRLIE